MMTGKRWLGTGRGFFMVIFGVAVIFCISFAIRMSVFGALLRVLEVKDFLNFFFFNFLNFWMIGWLPGGLLVHRDDDREEVVRDR
jgi:hypothetical protein